MKKMFHQLIQVIHELKGDAMPSLSSSSSSSVTSNVSFSLFNSWFAPFCQFRGNTTTTTTTSSSSSPSRNLTTTTSIGGFMSLREHTSSPQSEGDALLQILCLDKRTSTSTPPPHSFENIETSSSTSTTTTTKQPQYIFCERIISKDSLVEIIENDWGVKVKSPYTLEKYFAERLLESTGFMPKSIPDISFEKDGYVTIHFFHSKYHDEFTLDVKMIDSPISHTFSSCVSHLIVGPHPSEIASATAKRQRSSGNNSSNNNNNSNGTFPSTLAGSTQQTVEDESIRRNKIQKVIETKNTQQNKGRALLGRR
jgi:hypothetical protein